MNYNEMYYNSALYRSRPVSELSENDKKVNKSLMTLHKNKIY